MTNEKITHIDLFSGIGGFSLAADRVFGNVAHVFVEWEPFCQAVLRKHWPEAEIHGDINRFVADARIKESKNQSGYNISHGKKIPRLGDRISSLEVSLASPSPMPDEEAERQTTATSGQACLTPSLFSDQSGSLLKTLRDSLLGTKAWFSKQCALTWKRKVTKYSRSLYQLAPSARRTEGIESGLLATPAARDYKGTNSREHIERELKKGRRAHMGQLPNVIMMLKTPAASDAEGGVMEIRPGVDGKYKLRDQIPHATGGKKNGLRLQPAFVEWMMGFPEGWTEIPDSKLLEMRSSRRLRKKL